MPSKVLEGSGVNLDIFVHSVKHAQISGRIAKKITALKASNHNLEDIVNTISSLDEEVRNWRDSLPPFMKWDSHGLLPDQSSLPPNVHPYHVCWQAFSYYGSLIAIHSVLVHPWNAMAFRVEPNQKQQLRRHVAHSTSVVVHASRKMVQNLRHITITASTPKWYVSSS